MLKSLYEEDGITASPRLAAEIVAAMEGNTRAKGIACNHLKSARRKGTYEHEISSFKEITKAGRRKKEKAVLFSLSKLLSIGRHLFLPPQFFVISSQSFVLVFKIIPRCLHYPDAFDRS
jgi:hypothetical protein